MEIETHASKKLPACTRRGMRSGKRDALGAWWRGWEAKIGARGGGGGVLPYITYTGMCRPMGS